MTASAHFYHSFLSLAVEPSLQQMPTSPPHLQPRPQPHLQPHPQPNGGIPVQGGSEVDGGGGGGALPSWKRALRDKKQKEQEVCCVYECI